MARDYDGPVRILGIGSLDNAERIAAFVERHRLDAFDHVSDPDGSIRQRLGVRGQPNWLFIDGETGRIDRVIGALDGSALRDRLDQLADG